MLIETILNYNKYDYYSFAIIIILMSSNQEKHCLTVDLLHRYHVTELLLLLEGLQKVQFH